jgi:multimeric flavodoxin WrbA
MKGSDKKGGFFMDRVLALVASPRRLGNSELMAKEINRHLPGPHRLQLVRLPDMDIRPCRACYSCLYDERTCSQKDDFPRILEAILGADALILAAPAYLLGANASLKRFVDRGLSLHQHFPELWGTPAVAVTVAGIPGMEGYTKLCLESAARLMGLELKASEVVYGALPGEVFLDEGNRRVARDLAAALLGPPPPWRSLPWRCPACGGDTFRFLGPDRVRCMTCSSPGRAEVNEGQITFAVSPPEDHFFLTVEGALHHGEWLRQMKERFRAKKQELKAICLPYLHDGEWLESSRKSAAGHSDS